jgi:hypothetical protein
VQKRDNKNVQLVPPPENYGDNGNTASNQRKQLPQWLREQQEERSRGMYMKRAIMIAFRNFTEILS